MYSVTDRNKLTKAILTARKCKNSTDFIFITHDIYELLYPSYALQIDSILAVEAYNKKKDWIENVCFSQALLDSEDSYEKMERYVSGYRTVLDFLINDESCSSVYPMEPEDTLGWQIWSELDKKYAHAKKRLKILKYKNDRNSISI